MTPPSSDDIGALTRRERRRRKSPPSFDEVAGRSSPHDGMSEADAGSTRDRSAEGAAVEGATAVVSRDAASEPAATGVIAPETIDADTSAVIEVTDQVLDEAELPAETDVLLDEAPTSAAWADETSPATALLWVDPASVAASASAGTLDDEDISTSPAPDILADAHVHGPRSGWLVPLGALLALGVAYAASTLLWPLHELPASVEGTEITVDPAEAATLTWPAQGSAAISVSGVGVAASSADPAPIASITKVVSAMLVLDRMPLQPGEQGPEFSFTYSDSREYWTYLRDDQSALDVPVGGTLTEYQMLQGILLGSANNYIDRLADEIWGSEDAFDEAAAAWLSARGLDDITIVTPAGRDTDNVATPEALTRLAEIAMANPVFAEIVGTGSVDLPGAGTVQNSNGLLGEPGIVGVKTGTLDGGYNLLSAKDVTVGDTTLRLYAAVLGQGDNDARLEASRVLFAEAEAALQAQGPVVTAGTVVGEVNTPWGTAVDIVTDADAGVVLWNSAAPTANVVFDLDDSTEKGADVGTLTVTGPLDSTDVQVSLAEEIQGPSPWWRLTHPLELFGIID